MKKTIAWLFAFMVMFSIGLKETYAARLSETEPNDSHASATPITVNNSYEGILSTTSDNDYYAFSLAKDGNITISMPNIPQKQWGIEIKDTKGNTLDSLATNNSDFATGDSSLQLGLPKGDYFVQIYRPSYGDSEETTYTFALSFEESDYYEKELNDTAQSASSISVNQRYSGNLNETDDNDYYQFTLKEAGNVKVQVPNIPHKQWGVILRNSSGDEMDQLLTHNSEYTTGESEMEIGLPAGVYYLQFYRPSYGESENTPYKFTLGFDTGDFYEKESNNTSLSATNVVLNNTYHAVLNSNNDNDYYTFHVAKSNQLEFSMPNMPNKQWAIILRDSTGEQIESITTNNSEYTTGDTKLQINLQEGQYFLQIYRPSYGDSEEVPYRFSISSPDATDDSFVEWEEKTGVSPSKSWDVTFNLPFDTSTILEKNLYVTDQKNDIVPLLYIVDRELDSSVVTLAPVKNYTNGTTYTLWIKEVKGKNGQILKKNVKMNFTIAN